MHGTRTARNGKGQVAVAVAAPRKVRSLRRLMPVAGARLLNRRFSKSAGLMLVVFLVVAIICAAVAAFRSVPPAAIKLVSDRRAQATRVDALVKEILDRPLFNSDRSPAPEPVSPEELAKLRPPVLKSHLTGITILPATRLALFVGDENKYRSLKEGDDIDGFKLRRIEADHVVLASPFGEQIVRPAKGTYETVRNTKPIELGNFDPDK